MHRWIGLWGTCALGVLTGCYDSHEATRPDTVVDAGMVTDTRPRPGPEPRPDPVPEPGWPPESGCDGGDPCDPTRGCRTSRRCIDEYDAEIGGRTDPIVGCDDGAEVVPIRVFVGGYCTDVAAVDMGGCDPSVESSCGGAECARCIRAGEDSRGVDVTMCASSCTPSLDTNPCRDTYRCTLDSEVCLPGCTDDSECQVHRADTNLDGIIDPYHATDNPDGDHLTCSAVVRAWCDSATARCRHDGTPGAEAGEPCTTDFECEADGECLLDTDELGAFSGGYCSKLGCDLPTNECAGGGVCHERALGVAACLAPCEVGATDPARDPFANARDCRPGYACSWDGATAGPRNGGCVPANVNDARTPNVGAACTDPSDCYSPYGLGLCRDFGAGAHCTLFDCAAPGMPDGVCGDGAVCAEVAGAMTSLCIATCETAEDCLVGNGCWDTSVAGIRTGGERVCFPGCLESSHCRDTERCDGATMTSVGTCVAG